MRNLVYLLLAYVVGKFVLPMLLTIAVFAVLLVFVIPVLIRSVFASFQVQQDAEEYYAEKAAQEEEDFDARGAIYAEEDWHRYH